MAVKELTKNYIAHKWWSDCKRHGIYWEKKDKVHKFGMRFWAVENGHHKENLLGLIKIIYGHSNFPLKNQLFGKEYSTKVKEDSKQSTNYCFVLLGGYFFVESSLSLVTN